MASARWRAAPARPRPFFLWLFLPSLAAALLFVAALCEVAQYAFRVFTPGSLEAGGFTLENFARLARPIYLSVLADTLLISLATALFTLLLSYPVAYAMVRAKSDFVRSLIMLLAVTPLFTGEIVRTYAWILVLGSNGFVNSVLKAAGLVNAPLTMLYTRFGVIVALVQFSMPVMIIILAAALAHVDRNCERAAANLGAGPAKVFRHVTLPLTLPGIVSGTVVIFAWTMSAFSTPQLVGGGKVLMISNLVYLQGLSSFNFPFAAVLSLLALAVAIGALGSMRPFVSRLERKAAVN
ncbi:MAG: ABC transporter permease [Hyphomicrobiales bacterium]|nr:ABC transporter permease [Hyphomicrobiales bacterium]